VGLPEREGTEREGAARYRRSVPDGSGQLQRARRVYSRILNVMIWRRAATASLGPVVTGLSVAVLPQSAKGLVHRVSPETK